MKGRIKLDYSGFAQRFVIDDRYPFIARIYDGTGEPPLGFNTVRVALPAADTVILNWQEQMAWATQWMHKGYYILWEFDFALLEGSLEDEARFLTLSLAVSHFMDTLWPHFASMTFGVALFRGSLAAQVKEEVIDLIKHLASPLPEELMVFIFLDTRSISQVEHYFHLVSEGFGHIKLILQGEFPQRYPYAVPAIAWHHNSSPLGYCCHHNGEPIGEKRITSALCLSNMSAEELLYALSVVDHEPFRIIPESMIDQEWEGIDSLKIWPAHISERGWRTIRGFQAAGGVVHNLSFAIGSEEEKLESLG